MFGPKKTAFMTRNTEVETSSINTLGTGTTITGDIVTNGDIRINGTLHGSISSKGKIVIGPTGVVQGDISCSNADIFGTITGNVSASELLALKASANIKGDLSAGKLAIEPGAAFTGGCQMGAVVKEMSLSDAGRDKKKAEKIA